MNQTTKLVLDLLFGAAIPIAVLTYLTAPLGAPVAYVVAALVPVAWVAVDLAFITRSFNFITSYVGLSAIVSGILAFWFVDGVRFAIKDSASYFVAFLVFPRWAQTGLGVVGHVETPVLWEGTAAEQVVALAGGTPLLRVKELLDEAIRRRDEET